MSNPLNDVLKLPRRAQTPVWPPFNPWCAPQKVHVKIVNYHQVSHVKFYHCANLQFLTIFMAMGNFDPFYPCLTPFHPWGAPERVKNWIISKMVISIEFFMRRYTTCRFYSFWWSFLGRWAIPDPFDPRLTPFWPWGASQMGQNFCPNWLLSSSFS